MLSSESFKSYLVAVVVRRETSNDSVDPANEVLSAALDGVLARFKHPKTYVEAAELPRNAMAKVQKA